MSELERYSKWKKSHKYSRIRRNYPIRLFILEVLGNICVNCNESDSDVIEIDHINDDGYKFRTSSNKANPPDIGEYLKGESEFKSKYQLLCANCNRKKEKYRIEFRLLEKLKLPPF